MRSAPPPASPASTSPPPRRRSRPSATPLDLSTLNLLSAGAVTPSSDLYGTNLRRDLGPWLLRPLRPRFQGRRRGGAARDAPGGPGRGAGEGPRGRGRHRPQPRPLSRGGNREPDPWGAPPPQGPAA